VAPYASAESKWLLLLVAVAAATAAARAATSYRSLTRAVASYAVAASKDAGPSSDDSGLGAPTPVAGRVAATAAAVLDAAMLLSSRSRLGTAITGGKVTGRGTGAGAGALADAVAVAAGRDAGAGADSVDSGSGGTELEGAPCCTAAGPAGAGGWAGVPAPSSSCSSSRISLRPPGRGRPAGGLAGTVGGTVELVMAGTLVTGLSTPGSADRCDVCCMVMASGATVARRVSTLVGAVVTTMVSRRSLPPSAAKAPVATAGAGSGAAAGGAAGDGAGTGAGAGAGT